MQTSRLSQNSGEGSHTTIPNPLRLRKKEACAGHICLRHHSRIHLFVSAKLVATAPPPMPTPYQQGHEVPGAGKRHTQTTYLSRGRNRETPESGHMIQVRHRGSGAAGVGWGGDNSGEVLVAGCQETGVQGPSLSSPILTVWNPCFHHSGTAGTSVTASTAHGNWPSTLPKRMLKPEILPSTPSLSPKT